MEKEIQEKQKQKEEDAKETPIFQQEKQIQITSGAVSH